MTDRLSSPDPWLEIGTIASPHGLRGEVRVYPKSDFPERFVEPGTRWLLRQGQTEPQKIELLAGRDIPGKGLYVVELAGIDDRDSAEALRGSVLLVPDSDRLPLAADEFHVRDIIGLVVFIQATGERLGTVVDVVSAGHDLLQVQLDAAIGTASVAESPEINPPETNPPEKKRKRKASKPKRPPSTRVLIPFVGEIVPTIDLQAGRIEVVLPEGLIDLRI
jgi:16S rRNA processing protein RimM